MEGRLCLWWVQGRPARVSLRFRRDPIRQTLCCWVSCTAQSDTTPVLRAAGALPPARLILRQVALSTSAQRDAWPLAVIQGLPRQSLGPIVPA